MDFYRRKKNVIISIMFTYSLTPPNPHVPSVYLYLSREMGMMKKIVTHSTMFFLLASVVSALSYPYSRPLVLFNSFESMPWYVLPALYP